MSLSAGKARPVRREPLRPRRSGVPRATGAVALLCAAASGCWVPAETGRQMQSEIRALQQDLQQANKGVEEQRARLAEQMDRADKQIDEVAAALAELRRAAHNTDADFGVQLERLIKEIQELRGAIELTDYRLAKLETALQAAADTPGTQPEAGSASAATPAPQGQQEMLRHAAELAKKGQITEARGVYRDVVKKWPEEAGVADVAYYELGELYYVEKRYRDALPQYIKVAERFKSGQLLDDALFKIGMCSYSIGNLEDARIFFEEVATKHKKSARAKEAAQKLAEIEKQIEREKKTKKDSAKKGRKR